jgi:hypothetical protein
LNESKRYLPRSNGDKETDQNMSPFHLIFPVIQTTQIIQVEENNDIPNDQCSSLSTNNIEQLKQIS